MDSKASYDSEEMKDKVLTVDKFVPKPYQDESSGNNLFNLDLTVEHNEESKSKSQVPEDEKAVNVSDMSSCWGIQVVAGSGQRVNQSYASSQVYK